MLTAILTIIILLVIAIITLIIIIALCKSASTYSGHKCVGCKTEVHNTAPCGCRICRDCCTECYNIKIRCKYRDMDGQEEFEE